MSAAERNFGPIATAGGTIRPPPGAEPMTRSPFRVLAAAMVAAVATATAVVAQRPPFVPVSQEMLLKPSPDDWLMYSRTYDAQRFSPLKQINRQNVGQLKEVFKKELGTGPHESIPIVYRGVMYLLLPGASIQAVDASTGALIWEHH